MRSIATHRDHFVRRLSVRLSVCPSVTLAELCFAGDTCIPRNAATILFIYILFPCKLYYKRTSRYERNAFCLIANTNRKQKRA